jgi:hypothetical protein
MSARRALAEAERDAQRRQCPYCGEWKPSQESVWSHYRTCPQHPKRAAE